MYPPPELIAGIVPFLSIESRPLRARRSNDCWFSRPTHTVRSPEYIPCCIPLTTPWAGRVAGCRVATRFIVLTHMSFRMNYNSINVLGNLRAYIMLPNWADQLHRPRCWFMGNDEVALSLDCKGWLCKVDVIGLFNRQASKSILPFHFLSW